MVTYTPYHAKPVLNIAPIVVPDSIIHAGVLSYDPKTGNDDLNKLRQMHRGTHAVAREKESREGRQVLFPVGLVPDEKIRAWKLFDADLGDDSTREVGEYFIPDFSNWTDHQSITERFEVVRFEPNGKANRSVKIALADTLIRSNVS